MRNQYSRILNSMMFTLILIVREFFSGTTSIAQKYILNYLGSSERSFVTKSFLDGLCSVTFCSSYFCRFSYSMRIQIYQESQWKNHEFIFIVILVLCFIKPDPANAIELITKHCCKPENIIMEWLCGKVVTNKQTKPHTTETIHKML